MKATEQYFPILLFIMQQPFTFEEKKEKTTQLPLSDLEPLPFVTFAGLSPRNMDDYIRNNKTRPTKDKGIMKQKEPILGLARSGRAYVRCPCSTFRSIASIEPAVLNNKERQFPVCSKPCRPLTPILPLSAFRVKLAFPERNRCHQSVDIRIHSR